MISALITVEREKSLQDQTSSHVILKRTPVRGTMTTLPAFCGKAVKRHLVKSQQGMVSILLTVNKNFVLAVIVAS